MLPRASSCTRPETQMPPGSARAFQPVGRPEINVERLLLIGFVADQGTQTSDRSTSLR